MADIDTWMPIYIGSYLADTMHLSTEQHGAYFLLLLYGWRMDGRIPSGVLVQASICRMPPATWRKNRPVIAAFFDDHETHWTQKRQLAELEKASRRHESAKEKGAKGGRPVKPKNNLEVIPSLTPTKPEGKAHESSSHSSSPKGEEEEDYTPPKSDFKKALPDLYRAFDIDTPSHRDHEAMHALWIELTAKAATVTDLQTRAALYRERMPDYPLTPNALLNNWHTLKPAPAKAPAAPVEHFTPDSLWDENG